jgi:hypothetical protein
MNERIKELADKIWKEEYWDNPNTDKLLPAQLNRFAELIVRECVDIAIQVDKNPYLEDHYHARQIIKNINKHFGVKE